MKKLVELDAALEGLENLNAISFYEANEHSNEAYTETKDMLKALPTVDAVPVVHGRWVTDGMMMDCGEYLMTRCTACGTPFEYGYDMPYCPQCGAVMDGKDGDGND